MGHYYDVRCDLCNKFITEEDQSDDGLCEKCAEYLDRAASRRLLPWKIVSYLLAISTLSLLFWR